ncbi:post-transcriptional regulator [Virgibacillus sp. NKC19-3]|uniref:post-transcriptional regulator n=1 Tax=Virgibacillus saliphilus TaxID=2831674 RepID=UPI001C9A2DC9|nr:post-transcriptional regulator [Virgibacillus sp. NKC19-3]MBY7143280.1 post-transcriptional regulator [Virgibacillus sp. NKC19-3]
MDIVQSVNEWKDTVKPALNSKVDEFRIMGYTKANHEDIWNCLVQKVWKGNPNKRLYEIVQDIFHLGSNVYLSYLTVNAYQDDDLMASITALTNETNSE